MVNPELGKLLENASKHTTSSFNIKEKNLIEKSLAPYIKKYLNYKTLEFTNEDSNSKRYYTIHINTTLKSYVIADKGNKGAIYVPVDMVRLECKVVNNAYLVVELVPKHINRKTTTHTWKLRVANKSLLGLSRFVSKNTITGTTINNKLKVSNNLLWVIRSNIMFNYLRSTTDKEYLPHLNMYKTFVALDILSKLVLNNSKFKPVNKTTIKDDTEYKECDLKVDINTLSVLLGMPFIATFISCYGKNLMYINKVNITKNNTESVLHFSYIVNNNTLPSFTMCIQNTVLDPSYLVSKNISHRIKFNNTYYIIPNKKAISFYRSYYDFLKDYPKTLKSISKSFTKPLPQLLEDYLNAKPNRKTNTRL